jgi:GST-like protein
LNQNVEDFPAIKQWLLTIQARPAVQRAYEIGNEINSQPTMTEEAKKILFGQDANTVKKQH